MLILLLLVRLIPSARVVQRAEAAWLPAARTPASVRLRALGPAAPRLARAPAPRASDKTVLSPNAELSALLARVNSGTCEIDETETLCSFVEGLPESVLEDLLAVLPEFVDMLPPASLRGVLDDLPNRVLRATAASALAELAPHFALAGDAPYLGDFADALPPEVAAAVRAAVLRAFLQLSESVSAEELALVASNLPDALEQDLQRLGEEPEALLEAWVGLGVRGPAAVRGPPALFGPLAVLAAQRDPLGLRDLIVDVDAALLSAGVVSEPLAQLAAEALPAQARRALTQQLPGDGLRAFLQALPPEALRGVVASLPQSAEVDAALLRALAVAGVAPEELLEDLAEEDAAVGPFFPELEPFGEWTKPGRQPLQ